MIALWNGWDQQVLDREHNARASVPDLDAEVARCRTLSAAGHPAHVAPQPGRNHFNAVTALGDAADPMCQAAAAFLLA